MNFRNSRMNLVMGSPEKMVMGSPGKVMEF
jgi:hypothetical protein